MLYQTHALIHLDHIRKNLEAIRARVGTKRKILLAVKANAYGHGAVAVSKLAESCGIDWLGVATVPEGIELRRAGVKLPILKLSLAFPEEMEAALQNNLTLAGADQENLRALNEVATRLGVKARIHLKLDTGMGRVGVPPADAPALALWVVKHCPAVEIEGVFTHLPVSDDPQADAVTQRQVEAFEKAVPKIQSVTGVKIKLAHAANSGAILGHEKSFLNMVRPGIMAYGFYPGAKTPHTVELLSGLSFLSRLAFIKQVRKDTPIGYGHTWKAPQDTFIGTVPAGYADGFNRLFSNRGRVLIRGKSFPVVGRVCMDQFMVDLGPDAPANGVTVGDRVTLIGRDGAEEITAYEWAEKLGTITYEVTSQINARVERVYKG